MIFNLLTRSFNREVYIKEMKGMIDDAFESMTKEKSNFIIYTISIWTDPNSAISSINFDSKENSDHKVQKSNEWNKKYYEKHIANGDLEQAKLFEPITTRNSNPADFELSDFLQIKNKSIPRNWEEKTEGQCWELIEPILKEIGEYAFSRIDKLKIHTDIELGVNGRQDWYEFTWNNKF